jgi:hypothetical protein
VHLFILFALFLLMGFLAYTYTCTPCRETLNNSNSRYTHSIRRRFLFLTYLELEGVLIYWRGTASNSKTKTNHSQERSNSNILLLTTLLPPNTHTAHNTQHFFFVKTETTCAHGRGIEGMKEKQRGEKRQTVSIIITK